MRQQILNTLARMLVRRLGQPTDGQEVSHDPD